MLAILPTLAQGLPASTVGADVPSRRDIFAPTSLVFMIAIIIINVDWFRRHKGPVRTRAAFMILASLIFFSIWTLSEWAANTRWIEVGTVGGTLELAPPLVMFFALGWDVVVEIALLFMPAFFIPYHLHLIKREE